MKDVEAVRMVPAVVCGASANTAPSVIVWTAHVRVHLGGKVLHVNDRAKLDTTDQTVSTGSHCTYCM